MFALQDIATVPSAGPSAHVEPALLDLGALDPLLDALARELGHADAG